MNIICNKQLLVEAVSNVSRAVSSKNTLIALEGVLMRAHDNKVYLTGYDLELAISTVIDAKVIEEGGIVLTARIFLDMIRKMVSEDVKITVDKKMLTVIKGDETEYTILGSPAAEYPELPNVEHVKEVNISQSVLKGMIDQTLFAVAVSDSNPVHTGSLFDIENGEFKLVSVDGYRLALRREKIEEEEKLYFVVPGKSLSEIGKLLKDEEEEAKIKLSQRHMVMNIGSYNVISRLLEGEFLDYNASITGEGLTTIRVNTHAMINAIERASLLISDNIKSPLRMKFIEGIIKLHCSTALGKVYDEINCKQDGENVEIGFNSRYMLDALRASGCDEIKMTISGALSPIKILPLEGESFIFLVLPVRLKGE